jgi:PAS domain S-box-containing protein
LPNRKKENGMGMKGLKIDPNELQEIVAYCDADGIILSWNDAGREITGFSQEDLQGYRLDSILAEGSRTLLGEILSLRKAGTSLPGMSLRLLTNFGMEVPVELTSVPHAKKGKLLGWVLIFRDATIAVQQREQLDKLDLLYRTLVENSPAIVYVLDPSGRLIYINDTAVTLLGYTKQELLGRELVDFVHPEDRERAYWPLRERRRFPRATQNCEFRFLTKTGVPRRFDLDYIYVSLNSIGLQGTVSIKGEAALGTQGIARDITELVLCREFSRQVSRILPICSICRRIRVPGENGEDWISLEEYISGKTNTEFSHTYCPDHMPEIY